MNLHKLPIKRNTTLKVAKVHQKSPKRDQQSLYTVRKTPKTPKIEKTGKFPEFSRQFSAIGFSARRAPASELHWVVVRGSRYDAPRDPHTFDILSSTSLCRCTWVGVVGVVFLDLLGLKLVFVFRFFVGFGSLSFVIWFLYGKILVGVLETFLFLEWLLSDQKLFVWWVVYSTCA